MLRKPCEASAAASRFTSSTVSVTRRMGLSREKPQYLQLLMHSFERYSGAKRRMILPKRCCVSACERRPMSSSISVAAGEIKCAKSASDDFVLAKLSRAAVVFAAAERRTRSSTGRALNSATKLTKKAYQARKKCRG